MHFKMLTTKWLELFSGHLGQNRWRWCIFLELFFHIKQEHLSYQSGSAFTMLLYGILWWQNVMRDSPKLNVWHRLLLNYRLWCLWFVEKTVNMNVYMVIFKILWYFSFRNYNNILFQQYEAPPRWCVAVRHCVATDFSWLWFGWDNPLYWPHWSLCLSSMDCFT
jgi:hypothetical protein